MGNTDNSALDNALALIRPADPLEAQRPGLWRQYFKTSLQNGFFISVPSTDDNGNVFDTPMQVLSVVGKEMATHVFDVLPTDDGGMYLRVQPFQQWCPPIGNAPSREMFCFVAGEPEVIDYDIPEEVLSGSVGKEEVLDLDLQSAAVVVDVHLLDAIPACSCIDNDNRAKADSVPQVARRGGVENKARHIGNCLGAGRLSIAIIVGWLVFLRCISLVQGARIPKGRHRGG